MTMPGTGENADAHIEPPQLLPSMIRSEERLSIDTFTTLRETVRLERFVVTEERTIDVTLRHEEIRIVREPAPHDRLPPTPLDTSAPRHQVIVLREERPVISVEVVPVERVWLEVTTVTDTETVRGSLRSEVIEDILEESAGALKSDRIFRGRPSSPPGPCITQEVGECHECRDSRS